MATKDRTTTSPPGTESLAPAASPPAPDFRAERAALAGDARNLRAAVTAMDDAATACFAEVRAIARVTLLAMETPETYRRLDVLGDVLNLIWKRCDDAELDINGMADEVGCGRASAEGQRRLDAMRLAQAGGAV